MKIRGGARAKMRQEIRLAPEFIPVIRRHHGDFHAFSE
jgi:hypothetical protein